MERLFIQIMYKSQFQKFENRVTIFNWSTHKYEHPSQDEDILWQVWSMMSKSRNQTRQTLRLKLWQKEDFHNKKKQRLGMCMHHMDQFD